MAATQSLTSSSITRSSGSSVCRLKGIAEDQQQQLVRFNIEDFDSSNGLPSAQNLQESPVLLEDGGVASSSSSNNGDIRDDDSCNEFGHSRATVAPSASTTTAIIQSRQHVSITLSAFNHHHHSNNLNRNEPQQQEELANQQSSTICHHCVQDRGANSCFDQHQTNLSPDQRRIRRLFALLRLWRPKTEMQPVVPSGVIESDEVGIQQESAGQRNNQHHPSPLHHHHHLHRHHHHHRGIGAASMSQATISEPEAIAATAASTVSDVRPQAATGRHSAAQQRSCSHYMMRNPIMFVPTCASNVPFATNIAPITLAGPTTELGGVSEKKLWQSLVMPLVLGCIIFLIAVWTKQISLVLVNETLVMVIILAAVFIIMSGFAFWLAQDQVPPVASGAISSSSSSSATTDSDNDDNDDDDNGSLTGDQYQRELALRLHQHHRHYPRLSLATRRDSQHNHEHELNCQHGPSGAHRASHHHHHHHHNQLDDSGHSSHRKCCGSIAIIDCQPPDYYSAMQNSFPVNLYPSQTDDNNRGNNKPTNLVRINFHNEELQMCPPTYDELVNHNR